MSGADREATGAARPIRVLVAHNAYREPGGEDAVVAAETALLASHGNEVVELRRDNAAIEATNLAGLALNSIWSKRTYAEARSLIARTSPGVVHVHNTLPLLSPSLHWAAADAGVPVVQTLHNFRLACPQAMFLRDGKVCEECLGRAPLPAVVHGCYRGSRVQSAVVSTMLVTHRVLGTWMHKVERFIALSAFSASKFVALGIDAGRIVVKPNFVAGGEPRASKRSGFLFVGRLAPEKGLQVLVAAASLSPYDTIRIAGTGPEEHRLHGRPSLHRLGLLKPADVRDEMGRAVALLLPSLSFENFPMTVVEAYAAGLPVIASRIGSLAELVQHGETGLLFRPGDAADLAATMQWASSHPGEMAAMGTNARALYEMKYTPQANYRQLIDIYESARLSLAQRQRRSTQRPR